SDYRTLRLPSLALRLEVGGPPLTALGDPRMPGKRFWRWVVMLLAFTPMGCRAFCDWWAPCHTPAAYPAYPAGACCPPPCCPPPGYAPTNAYQQGTWAAPAVPQTRLSPNCVPCE